jgi:hypothetical protein
MDSLQEQLIFSGGVHHDTDMDCNSWLTARANNQDGGVTDSIHSQYRLKGAWPQCLVFH